MTPAAELELVDQARTGDDAAFEALPYEGDDVELDLPQLLLERQRPELAERAEAGVVDQQVDGPVALV